MPRPVQLHAPAALGDLRLLRLQAREAVGELFELTLDVSTRRPDLPEADWLARPFRIDFDTRDGLRR
ncbi:hypothetical protein, partial [Derxia gummosa]|uniref:Uncharacterized protein n=1 Tax=Derxia gummosa DSM 723 TaxID=1121388 RepID=A0A9B0EBP4_9BURK